MLPVGGTSRSIENPSYFPDEVREMLTDDGPFLILARGLWDCLCMTGADVSDYAYETVTPEGRNAGFEQWMRMRTSADLADEVVEAVTELRHSHNEEE